MNTQTDSALKFALAKLLRGAFQRAGNEYGFADVQSFQPREARELRLMFSSLKDRQTVFVRARYYVQKFARKF